MLNLQLANKYAKAIFEVAQDDGKINEYGTELKTVASEIDAHKELSSFLVNPQIQPKAKKDLCAKLFQEEISISVYNFLMLLIDKRREVLLQEIVREYQTLSNAAQNIIHAEVTVASALNEKQQAKLIEKLEESTGKKVVVRTKIDQSIIGGVVVQIGDRLIDGSIVRQMQSLQKQLMAN